MILGPMLFASLGMLVGTVTKSPETAGVIGNAVTFPMMFLSGTFFPIAHAGVPADLCPCAAALLHCGRLKQRHGLPNIHGRIVDIAVITVITLWFWFWL